MQGLTLQPDFQYFWNPGGHSGNPDEPDTADTQCRRFRPAYDCQLLKCAAKSSVDTGNKRRMTFREVVDGAVQWLRGPRCARCARMSDMRPILIAGPTASGKSGLALRLAEHVGGVVINADSMQVYRELRILTARPGPAEEGRVPHALYGFVPGDESYSAGRYAADVVRILEDAHHEGRRPIIVGGTGLYFKTLTEGLSPIPPIPDDVRAHWRREAAEKGAAHLHDVLMTRDGEMGGRLASGDTQRVVRALEVLDATGVSLAEWQRRPRVPVLDFADTIPLVVSIERDELARRIDTRFAQMTEAGALEEVLQLKALDLDPSLPLMTALGRAPSAPAPRGEVIARGGDCRRPARDAPVRQTAGDLGAWQYDCVASLYPRNKCKQQAPISFLLFSAVIDPSVSRP